MMTEENRITRTVLNEEMRHKAIISYTARGNMMQILFWAAFLLALLLFIYRSIFCLFALFGACVAAIRALFYYAQARVLRRWQGVIPKRSSTHFRSNDTENIPS